MRHTPHRIKKTSLGKRLARNWRKALVGTVGVAASATGGRAIYPRVNTYATQLVAHEERVVEENLRFSDLRRAKEIFNEWKGTRDLDHIVYGLAESFPARERGRIAERRKLEERGYAERSLVEIDQEIARESPETIQRLMEQAERNGMTPRDRAEWEASIHGMRNEVQTYLKGAAERAPARIRKKIAWIYAMLGAGSGAFALGVYLTLARKMGSRKRLMNLLSKCKEHDIERPYVLNGKLGQKTAGYRNGNIVKVTETQRFYDAKRRTYYEEGETREYDLKGKLLRVIPVGRAWYYS